MLLQFYVADTVVLCCRCSSFTVLLQQEMSYISSERTCQLPYHLLWPVFSVFMISCFDVTILLVPRYCWFVLRKYSKLILLSLQFKKFCIKLLGFVTDSNALLMQLLHGQLVSKKLELLFQFILLISNSNRSLQFFRSGLLCPPAMNLQRGQLNKFGYSDLASIMINFCIYRYSYNRYKKDTPTVLILVNYKYKLQLDHHSFMYMIDYAMQSNEFHLIPCSQQLNVTGSSLFHVHEVFQLVCLHKALV